MVRQFDCGWPPGLETVLAEAHIARMPEYVDEALYVDEAFVVLVHIPVENGSPQRESYVVGCPTREKAETRIRGLYPSEPNIRSFASPLSHSETEGSN
jgi:hypothetical protein